MYKRQILNRVATLKEIRKGDKLPAMIATALRQREFNKQFTGGPFAGFDVSCDILPRDYKYYGCFAIRHYQNNDRICSAEAVSYTHLDVYKRQGSQRRAVGTVERTPAYAIAHAGGAVTAGCQH